MHVNKLLISLENSQDRCCENNIKTTKFQSHAVSRPRWQS